MLKSEVYSWRLSPDLKAALEDAARQERTTISTLLERIVADWLGSHRSERNGDEMVQDQLHSIAQYTFGTIQGGNPGRSTQVRTLVRSRLRGRRAR